ncbi:MAG TPA: peptidase M20, partial [Brevundimonas sp.]
AERSAWGGWLGLIALVFVFGCVLQGAAPEAALLFVWPVLLAATTAALAALIDLGLTRPLGLLPPAVATVLGGAWLAGIGHFVFLGVGMDLPGALALVALLVLLLPRPLAPGAGATRLMLLAAAACLIAGVGLNLSAQLLAPASAVAEALP